MTEAINSKKELFEDSGVENVLRNKANTDVKGIVESIFISVKEFAKGAEQTDDITTVAFVFKDRLSNQREIL